MGSVIKGNRYRLIDNRSFEIPLPIKYELLKEDDLVASYEISQDEKVSVNIHTKHKENLITPVYRPLDISDIYFLFSSRVFQNGTPFTAMELQLFGLEKYNVYEIIRKTRGVTPYDTYWLRFDGDKCDYTTARTMWEDMTTNRPTEEKSAPESELDPFYMLPPGTVPFVATSNKTLDSEEESHVSDILSQHKVNYADKLVEHSSNSDVADDIKSQPVANNTMTVDEIDALLMKSGITEALSAPEPVHVEEPKPSGGKMSQEDIEKMLAAASAPEPAPVEEPKSSGGKMSQEDIEKMLAAASAPEPAPVEEPKPSGGKMSQEDIEKMLAAASAPEPEPVSVEEPKPSGGKMSQEDIEKMLAAASAPEPAPVEEPKPSGGKMSQEDIEKMLAAASAPEPAPVEEPKPSGGKMSQEEIEALLNGMKDDAGQ